MGVDRKMPEILHTTDTARNKEQQGAKALNIKIHFSDLNASTLKWMNIRQDIYRMIYLSRCSINNFKRIDLGIIFKRIDLVYRLRPAGLGRNGPNVSGLVG